MAELNPRRRQELRAVLRAGRLSRSQLVEATGLRKNTVLADVAVLVAAGILREVEASVPTRGRPRTPLEIDRATRHVVGVSIQPGWVQAGRVNLLGEPVAEAVTAQSPEPTALAEVAERLLAEQLDERTLAVGVTAPGVMDRQSYRLRFSAATPAQTSLSLASVVAGAGDRPVVLENDVNAKAARWLAQRRPPREHDTLFVAIDDGRLGATLLIHGRPNRGSIGGANELGHNRLPIDTPRCYCGHTGCLERIFSTPYLRTHEPAAAPLPERLRRFDVDDRPLREATDWLAYGIANAVNLLRVETLVLATGLPADERFLAYLGEAVRRFTLFELADRLHIEPHAEPTARTADAAAQVALAHLFYGEW